MPPIDGQPATPVSALGTLREQEDAARKATAVQEQQRKEALTQRIVKAHEGFVGRAKAVYDRVITPPEGYTKVTITNRMGEKVYTQPVVKWREGGLECTGIALCDGALHRLNPTNSGSETMFTLDTLSSKVEEGTRYPLLPGIDQDPLVSNEARNDTLPVRVDGTKGGPEFNLSNGSKIDIYYHDFSGDPPSSAWNEPALQEYADALEATLSRGQQLVTGEPLPDKTQ